MSTETVIYHDDEIHLSYNKAKNKLTVLLNKPAWDNPNITVKQTGKDKNETLCKYRRK
jgi:hypothetical protein